MKWVGDEKTDRLLFGGVFHFLPILVTFSSPLFHSLFPPLFFFFFFSSLPVTDHVS